MTDPETYLAMRVLHWLVQTLQTIARRIGEIAIRLEVSYHELRNQVA